MSYATAPYNFVSPVNMVLPSPFYEDMQNRLKEYEEEYINSIKGINNGSEELVKKKLEREEKIVSIKKESYKRYVRESGNLSGYIKLNIQTLTPCFVGWKENDSTFFSPADKPVIPGSTLRGALKNIFKIVTCSRLRYGIDDDDVNDDVLYYRTLADKDSCIREMYSKEIPDQVEGTGRNVKKIYKAGFLIHLSKENKYAICESTYSVEKDEDMVNENSGTIDANDVPPGSVKWDVKKQSATCFTGPMKKKKHYTIHTSPCWNTRYELSDEIVNTYKNDRNRHEKMNILDSKCHLVLNGDKASDFTGIPDCDLVAPCFYKIQNGVVTHFGFGRNHRIPYKNSIASHFPMMLSDKKKIDFSDGIFGNKDLWSSRIFFEDAALANDKNVNYQDKDWMKPLLEPKPTSYQLYLNQEGTTEEKKNNWNTQGVFIRGYKMYWHQKDSKNSWHFETNAHAEEVSASVTQMIRPLSSGNSFIGKIRFERLSKVELGALLKVCTIAGDKVCFKIGKGKALGMGSIDVVPSLYIVDENAENNSYKKIFSSSGEWEVADKKPMDSFAEYINEFDMYLANNVTYRESNTLRDAYAKSMKELRVLLDWNNVNNANWSEETKSMSMENNGYTDRLKLLTAVEVVEKSQDR